MRKTVAVLLFGPMSFFFGSVCTAEDGPSKFTSVGLGARYCEDFNRAMENTSLSKGVKSGGYEYYSPAAAYSEWIAGFVTAVNLTRSAGDKDVTAAFDDIAYEVKRYCSLHPGWTIANATSHFIIDNRKGH